ncbi:MAG: DUF4013 domain-containing protein [Halobacteria archaeon]|nr:DUF4013 domain-containing protein [Halobacteria archaeon]
MIADGLAYLSNDENWVKKLLVGGGILAASGFIGGALWFLIITYFVSFLIAFPVGGYYIRVMRATVRGEDNPPSFDNWGNLFKDGALAFVISAIYLFVPAVLSFISFFLFVFATASFTPTPEVEQSAEEIANTVAGLSIGAFVTFFLAFFLWLVLSYFLTIGLVNFAKEEEFGAAFSLNTFREVGFSPKFVLSWIVGFAGLGMVATGIQFIFRLVVMPIPGDVAGLVIFGAFSLLIMPFVTFYITVSSNRIMAKGFAKAIDS